MKEKSKKLVIVGGGEFAQIAYEYFMLDSEYEVKAFSVEKKYRNIDKLFGLPVIDFEEIEKLFPAGEYDCFVAVTYSKLNRVRSRLYNLCKQKGYSCATYISSHAFVWHNVVVGQNSFIFENNTVQYYVNIGNNVILWSGNHIGHRTVIEDDCWLTSHNVISGFCRIGKSSFIGVNATLGDNVTLAYDTLLGAGAVAVHSILEPGGVWVGNPAKKMKKTSYQHFELEEI